ncbi:MAG TPA: MoxR family ATPase [Gammaproteobacteria bacterium]|nr:MoxR family ATPase [Gammaproteobacteria bacterium]
MSDATIKTQDAFKQLRTHLESIIVGQSALLDRLLVGLLTGGHILLEGPPGLAKTTAVNALASGVHASSQRIQFTPDLMPGDLTGTEIFDASTAEFRFVQGPVFHEIILADEINRAPPKVQSALLEAMQEHQVTVNGVTRKLPELFIVMATQNPLEQSGTYPLPEAQLDRFLLHVELTYPEADEELEILRRDRKRHFGEDPMAIDSVIHPDTVLQARRSVSEIHVEENIEKYIVRLVGTTRNLGQTIPEWKSCIEVGASPRASLALLRAASAIAYLNRRDYVIPEDVIEMVPDVLRHRIILSFAAQAENIGKNRIIAGIVNQVPMP